MSMPGGAVAPYSNTAVEPSAVASGKSSAIFQLGEVLKTLVHHSLAFHDENTTDAAVSVIERFVGSFVSTSELSALSDESQRAPKEDISLRTPPGGAPVQVITGPVLDYSKLAAAILEQQKAAERKQLTEPQDTPEG